MDLALLSMPTLLGAAAILALCTAAAIVLLDAGRRTAALPAWHDLREDVARRTAERDDRRREIDQLKAQLDDLQVEKAQLEFLKKEKERHQAALEEIQLRLETIAVDRKKVEEIREQLGRLMEQKASTEREVMRLRETKERLEAESAILLARRSDSEAQVEEALIRHGSLTNDIAQMVMDREGLTREADKARSELREVEQRLSTIKTELDELRQRRDHLVSEANALDARIPQLRAERHAVEDRIAAAAAARTRLAEETGRLEADRSGLQAEVARLLDAVKARSTELAATEAKLDEARRQRDSVHTEIEILRKVIASLEGRVTPRTEADLQDLLGDLLVPPTQLEQARRPLDAKDENEALGLVRTHLEAQGLQFSERLLNAFHTSLKISHISPMTILSGVSGTGKSELPRQYATAMGIPFLQIAVQPRWDSPQDLFGFYNYLEHRYKPTDLARLFVHLDRRNWPKQAEAYRDHMAIVLMDEMNLARVDYYFSELLSRLEVRRDRDDQAAAEIELELGRLPAGWSKKIYPVRRVLFTGTVNEDQAAQTLSDKVIDRANVIRFPRPRRLVDLRPEPSPAAELDQFLPFSSWLRWQRTDPPDGRLDRWLTEIHGALEGLGRPFGHRTVQAIRAYVVNHPRSRQDPAEAMADQLEMRIFPKLRGLILDEGENGQALDAIERFIEKELRDEPLRAAFREARDEDLFLWRGVDRT